MVSWWLGFTLEWNIRRCAMVEAAMTEVRLSKRECEMREARRCADVWDDENRHW